MLFPPKDASQLSEETQLSFFLHRSIITKADIGKNEFLYVHIASIASMKYDASIQILGDLIKGSRNDYANLYDINAIVDKRIGLF